MAILSPRYEAACGLLIVMVAAAAPFLGCGGSKGRGFVAEDPPPAAQPTTDGGTEAATTELPPLDGPYEDFPAAPITDPSMSDKLFDGVTPDSSGGPCLSEPEIGSMVPRNWLRPRFRWTASSDQKVFELRVHAKNQMHDLVVLTKSTQWTMPQAMWDAVRIHSAGQPMTVTITGGALSANKVTRAAVGSTGPMGILPVDAPGTIVYWTTGTSSVPGQGTGTALKGFRIGDETVATVLKPSQVPVNCVACHNSTPDGEFVGFSVADNPSSGNMSRIELRSVDGTATQPTWLTDDARALLQRTQNELPVFSKAHYQAGDRIALSLFPVNGRSELIWTDLEATSQAEGVAWGVLARTGDTKTAGGPSFSHDGNTIVYSSATNVGAGTIFTDGDLYAIPYTNRQGGQAAAIGGADDPRYNEFFPSFSPDDQLIVFNRSPNGTTSYNNAQSEVFVIPASGGTATRLKANDPPACSTARSPGVTNSWPKWSPEVKALDGKTYYFIVFSSTRDKAAGGPQLYVTPVVVDGTDITTYAALYLWNQPEDENNHTPSWDSFAIPPVPPPPPK